jgi:hypothetical protein
VVQYRDMKVFAVLVALTAACSGAVAPGAASSSQQADAEDGGTCQYPAGVDVDPDASGTGCFAGPAGRACAVSSGATVLPDGGVSGGTESCKSFCGSAEYQMSCQGNTVPEPSSSLGCQVIPIPTPADVTYYCCPCD